MLGNAAPTPYDLRFSLFGIPVRVHPLFWVFSAIMGWSGREPSLIVLWVACVFVSILIHELGHALAAQSYGWPPHIVMYSFGGYASFQPGFGYTPARRIYVTFAGPGAGFLFYGCIVLVDHLLLQNQVHVGPQLNFAIRQLKYINLWWGLVNLLPIYPLDGGQISRELFVLWNPRHGEDLSLKLSVLVGGGMAVFFFSQESIYTALLFGSLALESLTALQGSRYR